MAAPEVPTQKEETPVVVKKTKKTALIAGIVAGIFVLEGAVVFTVVKMINRGPAEAIGLEIPDNAPKEHPENPSEQTEEIPIVNQFECLHSNTGRNYAIHMTIYALVPKSLLKTDEKKEAKKEGEAEATGIQAEVTKHIARIRDRFRTVIAGADAGTLCLTRSEKPDYGLSTLRRQFKSILDEVLGKGKVKDVVVSDYMPTPMD